MKSVWNIEWFLRRFIQSCFHWLTKSENISLFLKMWTFIVTLFNWYHDTVRQSLYPELTRCFENLVISTTVPVCCIAIQRNQSLFAVEHKKFRIRHKLLYVRMYTALYLRFHPLCFTVLKRRELMIVLKWRWKDIFFTFSIRVTSCVHVECQLLV